MKTAAWGSPTGIVAVSLALKSVDFRHHFNRLSARTLDAAMCGMMYAIQRRHRLDATSREALVRYIDTCAPLSRDEYFQHAPAGITVAHGSQPPEVDRASPI